MKVKEFSEKTSLKEATIKYRLQRGTIKGFKDNFNRWHINDCELNNVYILKNKNFSIEDKQFIIDNYLKMNNKDISSVLNRSISSVLGIKRKLGLTKKNAKPKKWTEEEILFLIDHYRTMSYPKICKELNIGTPRIIQTKIKQLGLTKRYIVNDTYFDIWSSDMAYILGFITADGCITDNNRLMIKLQKKDVSILEFIQSKLCPEKPIYFVQNTTLGIKRTQRLFEVSSTKILESLAKLGVVPRKTAREILPDIPDEFKNDYLRGLFDGDGCIYISDYQKGKNKYTRKYYSVNKKFMIVSASKSFLTDVKNVLGNNLGKIYISNKVNIPLYCWGVNVKNEVDIIYNKMYYDNDVFCLKRKREKFEFSHYENINQELVLCH